jgi:hypothetical protein
VAAQIADKEPPIDILINNAGALFATRRLTEEGRDAINEPNQLRRNFRGVMRSPQLAATC